MGLITRGISFQPTEIVTSPKLRQLIENADIRNISWSEFSGPTVGISVFSAPSGAAVGWISCEYEAPTNTVSTYSDVFSYFNYFIQSPTGKVVLFKMDGFETRRFIQSQSINRLGGNCVITTPANSATLTCDTSGFASAAYGQPHVLGPTSYFTATTSPTDTSNRPRIVMRGMGAYLSAAPSSGLQRYMTVHDPETFGASSSTTMDKILGVLLQDVFPGTPIRVETGYFMGAPLWRAG